MKRLALIFAAILPSLLFGRIAAYAVPQANESVIYAHSEQDKTSDHALNKDICILASQGWTFSGSENSVSPSLRTSQTTRRSNSSTKSGFRLVRSGKVIDTHNFNPFFSALFLKADGAYSPLRYIYSICCLRL